MRAHLARIMMAVCVGAMAGSALAQPSDYTNEAQYLADLASMGYEPLVEDFDSGVWSTVRYPDASSPSVTAGPLTWTGNGQITTNLNWGRNGSYGVFTIFDPVIPEYYAIQSTETLYAAGGWFNSNPDTAADIAIIIDGTIMAERNIGAGHQFVGVIVPDGFTAVEFREIDSEAFIGADDFTFAVQTGCPADLTGSADPNNPAYGIPDGFADASDFFYYLDRFAAGDLGTADLTGSADPNNPAYGTPDGTLDASDFFFYLGLFAQGC